MVHCVVRHAKLTLHSNGSPVLEMQQQLPASDLHLGCRHHVEKYMQAVFAASAAMLFIPVLFHRQNVQDVGVVNTAGVSL